MQGLCGVPVGQGTLLYLPHIPRGTDLCSMLFDSPEMHCQAPEKPTPPVTGTGQA